VGRDPAVAVGVQPAAVEDAVQVDVETVARPGMEDGGDADLGTDPPVAARQGSVVVNPPEECAMIIPKGAPTHARLASRRGPDDPRPRLQEGVNV